MYLIREMSYIFRRVVSLYKPVPPPQGAVDSLDLSPFATRAEVEEQSQQSSELGERMESVEGDMGRLTEQIEQLKVTNFLT